MPFNIDESVELKMKSIDVKTDLSEYYCVKMPLHTMSLSIPVMVTFEGEVDNVDLPGETCDEDVDLSPSVNLNKEIHDWIKENITSCYIEGFNIYFKHEEDAMAFKLKWI